MYTSLRKSVLYTGFFFVLAFSSGCQKGATTENDTAKRIDATTVQAMSLSHIKLAPIEETLYPEVLEVPGKISIPDKNVVNITARVQGRIEAMPLAIGDRVVAGQSLGQIWSSDLLNAVEELKMAETQKDRDLINLSRNKLVAMGLSPGDAVAGAKSYPLRSPMTGVVLDKKLNAGSAVQPGDLMMVIGKVGSYQFAGEVTPDLAPQIHPGMKVRFPESIKPLSAKVINVNPLADPNTNLVKVRCAFDQADQAGLPQESYLRAEVVLSEKASLVAPSKALIVTPEGDTLFIRDVAHPDQFKRIAIQIISRNKTQMSLLPSESIRPGTQIVVEGALLLQGILEQED